MNQQALCHDDRYEELDEHPGTPAERQRVHEDAVTAFQRISAAYRAENFLPAASVNRDSHVVPA